jgi:hypothetical protein
LVCIEELYLNLEVITCISRILRTCMTDLWWFPRKQRKLYSDSRRHLSAIAREPEKITSNIQNTYFVMTQSWFPKVSNTSANCPIW